MAMGAAVLAARVAALGEGLGRIERDNSPSILLLSALSGHAAARSAVGGGIPGQWTDHPQPTQQEPKTNCPEWQHQLQQ